MAYKHGDRNQLTMFPSSIEEYVPDDSPAREGRRIQRFWNEETTERCERQFLESQEIYELRKQKVELPFGHIKRNLGHGQFLMRGLYKVQGEASLVSSCFNMVRMINRFGVKTLMEKISQIQSPQPA